MPKHAGGRRQVGRMDKRLSDRRLHYIALGHRPATSKLGRTANSFSPLPSIRGDGWVDGKKAERYMSVGSGSGTILRLPCSALNTAQAQAQAQVTGSALSVSDNQYPPSASGSYSSELCSVLAIIHPRPRQREN